MAECNIKHDCVDDKFCKKSGIYFHVCGTMYTFLTLCLHIITGGRRFSEGTSADREIQRTLMEVGSIAYTPFTCVIKENIL